MGIQNVGGQNVYVITANAPRATDGRGKSYATLYSDLRWQIWGEVQKSTLAQMQFDQEIYKTVNKVITQINQSFERAEEEINKQLAQNKSLVPGSREYDIALDQLFRKRMGEPQQV